jgi:hypothetical protein
MSFRMSRKQYADMFGPTTGDAIRLADTDLFIEIERDYTVYGDEVKFGGGKVIRDGMGQHPLVTRAEGALDVVITNAVIVDYTGIYKADIGIRDGRIAGIGKSGNPLLMDEVDVDMDDRLVLFDHLKLEPNQDIQGLGQMQGYTHYGSMIVINKDIDNKFIDQLYELLQPFSEAEIGLSMLTVPGFTLRILAHRTQDVEKLFSLCHGHLRECKLDKQAVFLRKY